MKTHFTEQDITDVLNYLEELSSNPKEKERFNRSIKKEAERERKRKDGEFSALFMEAFRIP